MELWWMAHFISAETALWNISECRFDVNTPNAGRQFYWLNWRMATVAGARCIMIRAVVGDKLKKTSINDILQGFKRISVWPNPATDYLNIYSGDLQFSGLSSITVYDLYGQELMKSAIQWKDWYLFSCMRCLHYYQESEWQTCSYNRLIKTR